MSAEDMARKVADRLVARYGQQTFTANDAVTVGAADLFWLIQACRTTPTLCPRVVFDCGHVAFIWPEEYGDGSAWCQACGEFQCYDRCAECASFDCDHRETK